MKMSYFFKQTHISRKRIVLIFSDLLRQITLCLSSKDESATLKNSDTGAKFLTLFNMNWTLIYICYKWRACSGKGANVNKHTFRRHIRHRAQIS